MKKRFLAVLLSFALVLSSSGALYGEPLSGDSAIAEVSENKAEASGNEISGNEISGNETETPGKETETLGEVIPGNGTETPVIEGSDNGPAPVNETSGNEVSEPAAEVSEDSAGMEESSETAPEETVSGESISEDEAKSISSDEALAQALDNVPLMIDSLYDTEKTVYQRFSVLKKEEADKTYDADEAYFEAETEEEAKRTAEAYGAELISFQYGIAVMKFDIRDSDLSNVLLRSMYKANEKGNSEQPLQADIWPNYIDHIFEEDEPSKVYTADPDYDKQWYHEVISDNAAWAASNKGDGAVVAVIDTGVDAEHEDLKDNIIGAYETLADSDNPEDQHSHGTHCCGIVAAAENNVGGVGVAPKASIISIRAANANGSFKNADVVAAIKLATEKKVNVISMSFGGYRGEAAAEKKALEAAAAKGITLIAAAGNDRTNEKSMPAAYDCVTAVASYDKTDALSYFSNYGDWVNIAAPGSEIYSTVPEKVKGVKYQNKSGTSMACPVVSGVAALIYASDEGLRSGKAENASTVKEILLDTKNSKEYKYGDHSVTGGVEPLDAVLYIKQEKEDDAVTVDIPSKPVIATETDSKTGAVKVTFSGSDGAEIHYTTDGSVPALSSASYNGAFVLSEEGKYTVNAIAVKKAPISHGYKRAASEVATKKIMVKIPKKAVYNDDEIFVVPDFEGPVSIVPGKSVKLTASVSPNNSEKKTIVCEKAGGSDKITVNNSGVVKVAKNAGSGDSAMIKMSVKDCPNASVTISVNAASKGPVDSVTSGYGKEVQVIWTTDVVAVSEDIISNNGVPAASDNAVLKTSLDATAGLSPAFGGSVAYSFKSSNKKIAKVNSKGIVTACGNGKATITVTALDGSKKTVKIKVKCMTPVTGMYIATSVGQKEAGRIGAGSTVTLKPVMSGKGKLMPSEKKVEWKIKSGSGFTVNKSGKVKCDKNAKAGSTAVITCTATDGSKTTAEYTFTVKKKTKYMGVVKKIKNMKGGYTRYNFTSSKVSEKEIKTGRELDVSRIDRYIREPVGGRNGLLASPVNTFRGDDSDIESLDPKTDYIVSVGKSKNMLILDRDERGSISKVSISKPGNYKIIYKAVDGSNKKFTLKFKVKK